MGVSPATVLRWVQAGELPSFRLPSGALRFDEAELRRWLDDRRPRGDRGVS
jgi:excisionase family DNA binding protein